MKSYQLKFDDYSLLLNERILIREENEIIKLSSRAFDLLVLLVENEGKVLLKQELLNKVWANTFVEEGNLAVAINSLRKVLKTDNGKTYIETYPKRGYRFTAKVEKVLVEKDQKLAKQSFSVLDSRLPNRTEKSTASLPQSAHENTSLKFLPQLLRRRWLLLTIFLLTFSLGFGMISFSSQTKADNAEVLANQQDKIKIAILPFVDLRPDSNGNDLGGRFSDSIMFELSKSPKFSVVSTIPIEKYFQKIPQPAEIKKENGVDFVLAGTFIRNENFVEVDSQLIDVKTGKIVITAKELVSNNQPNVVNAEFIEKLTTKIKLYTTRF